MASNGEGQVNGAAETAPPEADMALEPSGASSSTAITTVTGEQQQAPTPALAASERLLFCAEVLIGYKCEVQVSWLCVSVCLRG
jgi:hypothetical protein